MRDHAARGSGSTRARARCRGALLALGVVLGGGAGCDPFTLAVEAPREANLIDDASFVVSGRLGNQMAEGTFAAFFDGVDLVAALGLVPPFAAQGGVVSIAGVPATISDFTYDMANPNFDQVSLRVAGAPAGVHVIVFQAFEPPSGQLRAFTRTFETVGGFSLLTDVTDSGGLALARPEGLGMVGEAFHTSLGQGATTPLVPLANGDTVREGLSPIAFFVGPGGAP